MDHERARELLPWLANDTLNAEERRPLEEHLASCEECRAEWRETLDAFDAFDAHLPPAVLIERAEGQPSSLPAAVVDRHLEICASCRQELALVEEGRQSLEDEEPEQRPAAVWPPPRRMVPAAWRTAAMAATVTAVAVLGGWLASWQLALPPAGTHMAASDGPRGVTWMEMTFAEAERGGDEPEEIELPAGDLVLLLTTSRFTEDQGPFELEIVGPDGRTVSTTPLPWQSDGFTLVVGPDDLPAGEVTLRVHAEGAGETAEHQIQVAPPAVSD